MRPWYPLRSRSGRFSVRIRRSTPLILGLLLALALAVAVINISVGAFAIAPVDVIRTLLGAGLREHDYIILSLRLPRTIAAFLAGTGLALSGGILQAITRNPLASPDVIGITGGANLVAASVLVWLPAVPWVAMAPAAFGGALCAAALTYLLARKNGEVTPIRLILVGIGVAAAAQALVTLALSTSTMIYRVSEAMLWITGSVYGRTWQEVRPLALWLTLLVPLALGLSRHLNIMQLGDDIARGLGGPVERLRTLLLLTSVGLAGVSVAAAGNIGFVGLMAPHIARRLVGSGQGALLPVAAAVGGLTVLTADLLGRTIAAPVEIPCGIITAAVGAPYFIYLLVRRRHA